MPTAAFSTDTRRTLDDLQSLIAFRCASIRGRARIGVRVAVVALVLLTVMAAVMPAYFDGAGTPQAARDWGDSFPELLAAFLALASATAVISGGGRELVSRENAVAYPVSPATDHLGALLMAPLNIAWLLQAWTLLALMSYVAGPGGLWSAPPLVIVWIALATALGQIAGWSIELVRRRPRGVLLSRLLLTALGGLATLVIGAGWTGVVVEPAQLVVDQALSPGPGWLPCLVALVLLTGLAVVAGVVPASAALRRPPHEEHRLESSHYQPRPFVEAGPDAWSDVRLMMRVDRASVFRSIPLRRGVVMLTLMPLVGGIVYQVHWPDLMLFPGLIASGVVLLFGVNAWSLDGHGILLRESLPVSPRLQLVARVGVLLQLTAVCVTIAIVPAAIHSGSPDKSEVVALLCALVVGPVQVVAAAIRWSLKNPYAVDLLSARAVPAPPIVMVGYSTRLALVTTLTGLLYGGLSQVSNQQWPTYMFTVIFLAWAGGRLWLTARTWDKAAVRARVVAAVAA